MKSTVWSIGPLSNEHTEIYRSHGGLNDTHLPEPQALKRAVSIVRTVRVDVAEDKMEVIWRFPSSTNVCYSID